MKKLISNGLTPWDFSQKFDRSVSTEFSICPSYQMHVGRALKEQQMY